MTRHGHNTKQIHSTPHLLRLLQRRLRPPLRRLGRRLLLRGFVPLPLPPCEALLQRRHLLLQPLALGPRRAQLLAAALRGGRVLL